MGTIAAKLQKLIDTKNAIKTAIIAKGQSIADTDTFASYAEKISAIETGVDTSDATATASDMASGVTAYVNGEKITGTVPETTSSQVHFWNSGGSPYLDSVVKKVMTRASAPKDFLIRQNGWVYIQNAPSDFGDATAADVASGKTFTSSVGVKVTGTATGYSSASGVDTFSNIGSGTLSSTGSSYKVYTLSFRLNLACSDLIAISVVTSVGGGVGVTFGADKSGNAWINYDNSLRTATCTFSNTGSYVDITIVTNSILASWTTGTLGATGTDCTYTYVYAP